MPAAKNDLLQGTLDLLVLRTLALGPMHGWGISQRIQQLSADVLQVNQGSLYPALARLEQQSQTAVARIKDVTAARCHVEFRPPA